MTERIDFNALAAQCAQEEARLQFASFSRQDALALGLLVAQSAAQYDAGVAALYLKRTRHCGAAAKNYRVKLMHQLDDRIILSGTGADLVQRQPVF